MSDVALPPSFGDLQLPPALLDALAAVGYETPTAIQAATIPVMLAGQDLIGQAQTGTGKTAAFALPLLARVELERLAPQVLVLTPTRELAIQVAEAFQRYASHLPGFHVLPIYGGQDYGVQLRALRRGAHVVVGTPGRVTDHMRRQTLNLVSLSCLVLDEADEMLRMGFIDDVEWILEQTPPTRQVALFSATMPPPIRAIAERYLREPQEVRIRQQTTTASTIRQRYSLVSGPHKLDALTRILETESFEAMLVFVRTKQATVELAERLVARGYACAAINGDMAQKLREKTIEELRDGTLDLLVATDVAARGLDVDRVSHVVNYDIPYDPEAYVHRIGRTGRAGRHGDAILFVAPREQRMLREIERATRQPVERMELPSSEAVNDRRVARFMQTLADTLAGEDLDFYRELVARFQAEHEVDPADIAAALARLLQGDQPMLLEPDRAPARRERGDGERGWGAGREGPPGRRFDHDQRRPRFERGTGQPSSRDAVEEGGTPRQRPFATEGGARPGPRDAAFARAEGRFRRDDAGDERRPFRRDEQRFGERHFAAPPAGGAEGSGFPARHGEERPRFERDAARPPRFAGERGDERRPRAFEPRREDGAPGRDRADGRSFGEREDAAPRRPPRPPEAGMETFRLEVGHRHRVQPGNIVGAIANEAGLDARDIGRIQIYDDYSTVDLPEGMPKEIFSHLKKVWVSGQALQISRLGTPSREARSAPPARPHRKERHRDKRNKGAPRKGR